MFSRPTSAHRLVAIALPALLIACKDTTGVGARLPLSVSFVTATSAAGPTASLAPAPGVAFDAAPAPALPVVTKVQFVLSHIELGRTSATCTATSTATSHGQEDECEELELDPMLVDLTPGTGVQSAITAAVPVGTYTSFEAVVGPVRQDENESGAKAFLAKYPAFAGKSVRVEGTYQNKSFVYESALRGEIESSFDTPMAVTKDGMNLTVALDMSKWFRAADGTVIDPATATPGTANHELVARNIRRSFRAFEDNDRSGRDKH